MGVRVQISPEEYLRTSFEGLDREYVDGEVVERSMPTDAHSATQWAIMGAFWQLAQRFPLFGRPELRLQLGPQLYRVPDFSVFRDRRPGESVPSTPPFVTVEIVSPDDAYTDLLGKLRAYWEWGVPHVWLADPGMRKLSVYDGAGFHEVPTLVLPEFDFELTPAQLFD